MKIYQCVSTAVVTLTSFALLRSAAPGPSQQPMKIKPMKDLGSLPIIVQLAHTFTSQLKSQENIHMLLLQTIMHPFFFFFFV